MKLLKLTLMASAFLLSAGNLIAGEPEITSVAPTGTIGYGSLFTYPISATDPDSDPVRFYILQNEQTDANSQTGFFYATDYQSVIWQSFITENTGLLAFAAMQCAGNTTMGRQAFTIYKGTGTGGEIVYSDTLDFGAILDYHSITIPESAGVVVYKDSVYTLAVTNVTGYLLEAIDSNPYAGGRGSWSLNSDFQFITKVNPLTSTTGQGWLTLTDFENGTGTLSGTPEASDAGDFSVTLAAVAGEQAVLQPMSLTIISPVPAPTGLVSNAGNNRILLAWNKVTDPAASGYILFGGTNPNPVTPLDTIETATDTTFLYTGLSNGTPYFLRIKTVDENMINGAFSSDISATPDAGVINALSFDGSDQAVITGNYFPTTTNSFTIEFWVKPGKTIPLPTESTSGFDGLNSAHSYAIYPHQGTATYGSGHHGVGVSVGANGVCIAHHAENDLHMPLVFPYAISDWTHIAVVYDNNVPNLYINGVFARTGLYISSTLHPSDQVSFKFTGLNYGWFDGEIDEIRVWDNARTEEEIALNMYNPMLGNESGLISLINFNETEGGVVLNSVPGSNHGTFFTSPERVVSGAMNPATVPVELTSFSGFVSGNDVILNWETKSETNNYGWEIERKAVPLSSGSEGGAYRSANNAKPSRTSGSGLEWETVEFVSGKGTTNSPQTYSSRVTRHASLESFRLKQIDLDGTVSYSQILTIETNPTEFKLLGAYPNPFNPQTMIRYQLSEISTVKLTVYDGAGRLVAELVNGQQNPGQYSVPFHATGLASGSYFLRLTAGNQSHVLKILFLK